MQQEPQQENQQDQAFEVEPTAAAVEHEEAVAAESLEAQVQALEAKVAELQSALLYGKAEAENLRRRAQDDVAAAHKYAVGKFAGELLVVKDCLEMALKDNSSIENIKMGVEMTLRNLAGAFDKFQIKEIDPKAGDKLDPNKHQAMSAVEAEQEPNTVVDVMQKGYAIAERVLRPAMVVVAKAREE
ncbi:nucleotide exchange factor GrpE [Chitinimonas koreensis]|uniref:nucleotide exchange factor GrpE n=1 Tax=Chitinimonas koreensis TaxID=356302 RepID=UPI00041D43B1|nr:nucleotide exchange factor GrpE [Chitinimonas koreensis]QNM96055.1 nucleotide exchange factor GrpE [Chitinimonas koreensis]